MAADAAALPFRDGSFDLVWPRSASATCAARPRACARPGGSARRIAASAFAPGWTHPAKAAVEAALRPFGYRPPAWYLRFKQETEPPPATRTCWPRGGRGRLRRGADAHR